jgi:hypothetical protein
MVPLTIAVGIKPDGTAVNLYTGYNGLEALAAVDSAGASRTITEGHIFHGMPPVRTRKFNGDGNGKDDAAFTDEQARMQRINELKLLTHEDLAAYAQKLDVKVKGETATEKSVKQSMAVRMFTIVAIYDREQANLAAGKPAAPLPVISFQRQVKAREAALYSMSDDELKTAAQTKGVKMDGLNLLEEEDREELIIGILEKEFPPSPLPAARLNSSAMEKKPEGAAPGAVPPVDLTAKGIGK